MELAASPSADLFALADPAARGPPPLLRLTGGQPEATAPQAPFAAFLALLGAQAPDGELLPVTGKDLPLVQSDAELAALLQVPPIAPVVPAPSMLASAVEPGVRAGALAVDVAPSQSPALPPAPAPFAATVVSSAALAAFGDGSMPGTAGLPGVAPDGAANAPLAAAPPDGPDVSTAATGSAWLDELLKDVAARPAPRATMGADSRAAAQSASQPSPTTAPPPAAIVALPPDAAPQMIKVLRDDGPRAPQLAPVLGDTPVAPRVDWLPPSHPSPTAPTAPTSPAVAPPSTPVDTRAAGWHEVLTGRVQWLVDHQVGEARIKLNPPELGAIDVKISHVDEKSYVQLTAATAAARDELANGLHRLRELFSSSGLTLGGASVESGHAGHHGARADVATESSRASERSMIAPFAETEAAPRGRAIGRIDVFA